jgi:NADH-quinone oxidoreductase subunit F
MTRLDARRAAALEKWRAFEDNGLPVIFIGAGSCGIAAGAMEVREAIAQTLSDLRVKASIVEVGCIGPCYLEPLMDVKLPGKPRVSYGNVTAKRVDSILRSFFADGRIPKEHVIGHFGPEGSVDAIPRFFDHPMLKPQVRLVLRNCGIIDPSDLDHYLARDGYRAFEMVLQRPWQETLDVVMRSGLRGRGGAGFPTWKKWQACREAESDQRYMICNADEGDPGAFMNRSLIEGDPHAVLEGLLLAGYTIGASKGYVYIRAEYPLAVARLKNAIEQMRELGLLGHGILGSDFDFDIAIKEGAGAFVCGEETALIASIEGERGMPRTRPPFPAQKGLWGKPTIINNVETLGTIPNIIRNGPEWYAAYGTATSKGTKTFSLVGRVKRTGLIEVPMGTTLRQIVFDIGGGSLKPFKAVQTGGPSGGCLSADFLDTPIDYESLAKAGSIMGSGGLIILGEDACAVDLAKYFLNFTQKESCGKCVPCRVGTRHLADILDKVTKGTATVSDIDRLETLGHAIKGTALCALGSTAPNPVLSTLKYFRNEFLAHVREHRCPAGLCRDLVEYRVIPEKCTGCRQCLRVCPSGAIAGLLGKPHSIDTGKCVKCRACYEICRFGAVAGEAIVHPEQEVQA